MKTATTRQLPSLAARHVGYVVTVVVNATMLYLVNVWPGWAAVPFLTDDTRLVVPVLNVSLGVGLLVNLTYLRWDRSLWRAFGEVLTAGISLAVLSLIWRVFPFDFGHSAVNWALLARVVLVVAIVGTAIGAVAALVRLLRDSMAERPCGSWLG